MSVEDAMTKSVITVTGADPAARAADLLIDGNITGLPVVDEDGHVVGIVSDLDLISALRHGIDLTDTSVGEVMDVRPLYVERHTDLETELT
jgi:CBS domain-containing protein